MEPTAHRKDPGGSEVFKLQIGREGGTRQTTDLYSKRDQTLVFKNMMNVYTHTYTHTYAQASLYVCTHKYMDGSQL